MILPDSCRRRTDTRQGHRPADDGQMKQMMSDRAQWAIQSMTMCTWPCMEDGDDGGSTVEIEVIDIKEYRIKTKHLNCQDNQFQT